jgi:hypothetical protein
MRLIIAKKMWAYKDYQLVSGFPKRSFDPLFFNNPNTLMAKQDKVYLSKGSFLIEFNTTTFKIADHNVFKTQVIFPGLPNSIQASLYDSHNKVQYLFRERM